jgi:hypothetical protein
MAEAANVAKVNAGGSGDNIVADGYIKAVEKVWLDSYTIAFTNTNTTIDIAVLPENKKVTSIEVYIYATASHTSGTVSIGYSTDATVATFLAPTTLTHNKTVTSISLWGGGVSQQNLTTAAMDGTLTGFQAVTEGTATTISLKLNNWTMTSGTVKTMVRYT